MYANTSLLNISYIYDISLGTSPPPTVYGPLSYANYNITVEGISAFGTRRITHQSKILNDCPNW